MSKIQIVNVKEMRNAVELTVNHIHDAELIVDNALRAGFDGSSIVQPQPSGFRGSDIQNVVIGEIGGGRLEKIRTYLDGESTVLEFPSKK